MVKKVNVAILGPGNIGTDLMFKILRSQRLRLALMAGVMETEGIRRARSLGVETTTDSVRGVLARKDELDIRLVFDATSAAAHAESAPLLRAAGLTAIDLTPAAVGPYLIPSINLDALRDERNVNMVTCGGQATIPIVRAIARVAGARYAEIVSAIASRSAGPGTRANIDEFTETTAKALETVGGAERGKAIIILNPAEPPIMMSNTIYVRIRDRQVGLEAITRSVLAMVEEVRTYVPGYRLRVPPLLEGDKVTVGIQVTGAGDFLPVYAGNLDIMNAAALRTGERLAAAMLEGGR